MRETTHLYPKRILLTAILATWAEPWGHLIRRGQTVKAMVHTEEEEEEEEVEEEGRSVQTSIEGLAAKFYAAI